MSSPGRYRWRICALLLAATTINYIDRQVLGVLAPQLQRDLHWSEIDYGNIVTAFQAAYAIGLIAAGAIIDRLGTKIGYALALAVWSLAAMPRRKRVSINRCTAASISLSPIRPCWTAGSNAS